MMLRGATPPSVHCGHHGHGVTPGYQGVTPGYQSMTPGGMTVPTAGAPRRAWEMERDDADRGGGNGASGVGGGLGGDGGGGIEREGEGGQEAGLDGSDADGGPSAERAYRRATERRRAAAPVPHPALHAEATSAAEATPVTRGAAGGAAGSIAGGAAGGADGRGRARARLNEARQSLEVVGSAASRRAQRSGMAAGASERATASQTKVRSFHQPACHRTTIELPSNCQ